MVVTCEKCRTGYELDASAIGPAGRKVKCSNCGHIWRQMLPEGAPSVKTAAENAWAENDNEEPVVRKKIQSARVPVATRQEVAGAGFFPKFIFAVLILLNLVAGALAFGPRFLAHYPVFDPLAEKIRVYSSNGLEFQNMHFTKESVEDKVTLLVNGEIANNSGEVRRTPQVTISFIGKDGKKILAREYPLEKKYLNPGEKIPFEPKISDIPASKVSSLYLDIGNGLELFFR